MSIIFYLGIPVDSFGYMRIPIKLIPQEIIMQYNLFPLVSDVHVYIEVQKGMYVLPQSGILTNQLIARCLAIHGYHQTKLAPGLWSRVAPRPRKLVITDFTGSLSHKEGALSEEELVTNPAPVD
jgi:hypothetical protein